MRSCAAVLALALLAGCESTGSESTRSEATGSESKPSESTSSGSTSSRSTGSGSTSSDEHIGEGMAGGAALGLAVAGAAVSIFGGSTSTALAVGGASGAVLGGANAAMTGPPPRGPEPTSPTDPPEVRQTALRRVHARIGPSAFAGLEALTECRHEDALTWAQAASHTDNPDHALAGLWLSAMTYADSGRYGSAQELFPQLVEQDPQVPSEEVAERLLDARVIVLQDTRTAAGRPDTCA